MSPLAINWTVLAEIENKKYFTSVIKVVRGIAHFYSKGKKEITREDLNEFVQNTYGKSESMHLILHTNIVCKEFGFGVDHPEGHPCLLGPKTGDKDKTHKGHGKHLICKGKISGRKEFVYINEEFCDKLFIKNGQDITTDQVSKKELELKTKNEKVSKRKRDSDSEEDDEPNSKKAEIEIQNVQNIPIMNQDEILKPISEPIQTVQEVQLQSFSSMSGYDLGDMPLFDEPSITYPVEHSLEEMQDLAQQLNPFYELAQMEDQAIETQQILSIKDSNVDMNNIDMNNIDMNNIDMDNLDRMFKTEEFKSDPEQINYLLGNDVKRENNGNKSQGKQQQKMRIDNLPSFGFSEEDIMMMIMNANQNQNQNVNQFNNQQFVNQNLNRQFNNQQFNNQYMYNNGNNNLNYVYNGMNNNMQTNTNYSNFMNGNVTEYSEEINYVINNPLKLNQINQLLASVSNSTM